MANESARLAAAAGRLMHRAAELSERGQSPQYWLPVFSQNGRGRALDSRALIGWERVIREGDQADIYAPPFIAEDRGPVVITGLFRYLRLYKGKSVGVVLVGGER